MSNKSTLELYIEQKNWAQAKKCLANTEDLSTYAELIRNQPSSENSKPLLLTLVKAQQLDLARALLACNSGFIHTQRYYGAENEFENETIPVIVKMKADLESLILKIADTFFFPDNSNSFNTLPREIKTMLICNWIRAEYCANLPDNIEKHLVAKVFELEDNYKLEKFKERELASICARSFFFYFLNNGTLLNSEWITALTSIKLIRERIRIPTSDIRYQIENGLRGVKGASSFYINDIHLDVQQTQIITGREQVLARQKRLHQIIRKGFSKHAELFNDRLFGTHARSVVVNLISQSEHIDLESCSNAFAQAAKYLPSTDAVNLNTVVVDPTVIQNIKEFSKLCAQEHQSSMGTRYSGFWASDSGERAIASIIAETMIILARQGKIPLNFADDSFAEKRNILLERIGSLKVVNKSLVAEVIDNVLSEKALALIV